MAIDHKIIDQFDLLQKTLPDVQAHPANWRELDNGFDTLFQGGTLLMRDADAARVVEFVAALLNIEALDPQSERDAELIRLMRRGEGVPDGRFLAEPAVPGLTKLWFGVRQAQDPELPGTVPDLVERVNVEIGPGVAQPVHVVHVCGNCCPAHEPEVPEGPAEPFPQPHTDCGCEPRCDGSGVQVTVVDTGLVANAAQDHPWMHGVTGDPEDTLEADNVHIRDYGGHGTFVAGCVRVTAPKASVHVDGTMAAAGVLFEDALVKKLGPALVKKSPDIVVFSFAARTLGNLPPLSFDVLYENVIRHVKGLAFVAAVGCDGTRDYMWPAAFPWTISVGALSANWRTRAHFSNFGGWVDVYAPGEDLVNAYATGTLTCKEEPNTGQNRVFEGMANWSGTSFSTPLVAGMIAARMSRTGENGQQAAEALLRLARSQTITGVGPVLFPDQACASVERCACGHCSC